MNFHAIQQVNPQFLSNIRRKNACGKNRLKHCNHHQQLGFSLIEVMIAALVISIGMLGLAGLQLVSMKGSHQSYMRHQAMFVVQDLVERMRANPDGVRIASPSAYLLDTDDNTSAPNCAVTPTANCGASGASCNPTQLAIYDKYSVACKMQDQLMNGRIQVVCQPAVTGGCGDGMVGVQVSWSEREMGQETVDTIKTDGLFPADTTRTDNIIIYSRIH